MDNFIKEWISNNIIQILEYYINSKPMKLIIELLIEWSTKIINFIYEYKDHNCFNYFIFSVL